MDKMDKMERNIQGKVASAAAPGSGGAARTASVSAAEKVASSAPATGAGRPLRREETIDLEKERKETSDVRSMLGVAEGLSSVSLTSGPGRKSVAERRESTRKAMASKAMSRMARMATGQLNPETEQQIGGPREMITLNLQNGTAVERPILLETRELERPRLDALIGEIREHRNNDLGVQLSRQRKMRSVKATIMDLKYKRLDYGLAVWGGAESADGTISEHGQSMQPTSWREVNQAKARKNPGDRLHNVVPQERVSWLRAVEGQVRDSVSRPPARPTKKLEPAGIRSPGREQAMSPASDKNGDRRWG